MSENTRVMAEPTLHHSGFCREYFADRRGNVESYIRYHKEG